MLARAIQLQIALVLIFVLAACNRIDMAATDGEPGASDPALLALAERGDAAAQLAVGRSYIEAARSAGEANPRLRISRNAP